MGNTIAIACEDSEYTIRRRLRHQEQDKIDDLGWIMSVEGKTLSASDDLEDMDVVQLEAQTARQDGARLRARLVGVKRRDIDDLQSTHKALLIREIVALENEEKKEIESFLAAHPSEMQSDE